MRVFHVSAACALWATSISATAECPSDGVQTHTGIFAPFVDPEHPTVRQFRKIPFAAAPVGPLRWHLPVPVEPAVSLINYSEDLPPSCPQWPQTANVFTDLLSGYFDSGNVSEDCLFLGVWAPLEADKIPVIVFIHGGSFQTGGIDTPYQDPVRLAETTNTIVVSIR